MFPFRDGNFSVKRSNGKFNKVPSDQCIEQTINREQKCHGGIKGYSTSEGTVQRWVLTSHILARCFSKLDYDLLIENKQPTPKDLGKSRMVFNNESAHRSYAVLSNWGNPFDYRESLINLCSGIEAPKNIENDLLNAESIGVAALNDFLDNRIKSSKVSFYDPIKKASLKSFNHLKVKKVINSKERSVTIAAERSIFGRLLVVAKNRQGLSLKEVLSYSLSPIPWSLGLADGGLVKTVKSKLLSKYTVFLTTVKSL